MYQSLILVDAEQEFRHHVLAIRDIGTAALETHGLFLSKEHSVLNIRGL